MCCVSVRSLCDCHDQIYDLPFGTLVVSHDPLAIQHPGNPGTNTCLENEKPPKTPIEIRDFSGKRAIFFHGPSCFRPTKSSHNHPHPFSGAEPWLTTHGSFGKGLTVTRPEESILQHPVEVPIILRTRFF